MRKLATILTEATRRYSDFSDEEKDFADRNRARRPSLPDNDKVNSILNNARSLAWRMKQIKNETELGMLGTQKAYDKITPAERKNNPAYKQLASSLRHSEQVLYIIDDVIDEMEEMATYK